MLSCPQIEIFLHSIFNDSTFSSSSEDRKTCGLKLGTFLNVSKVIHNNEASLAVQLLNLFCSTGISRIWTANAILLFGDIQLFVSPSFTTKTLLLELILTYGDNKPVGNHVLEAWKWPVVGQFMEKFNVIDFSIFDLSYLVSICSISKVCSTNFWWSHIAKELHIVLKYLKFYLTNCNAGEEEYLSVLRAGNLVESCRSNFKKLIELLKLYLLNGIYISNELVFILTSVTMNSLDILLNCSKHCPEQVGILIDADLTTKILTSFIYLYWVDKKHGENLTDLHTNFNVKLTTCVEKLEATWNHLVHMPLWHGEPTCVSIA